MSSIRSLQRLSPSAAFLLIGGVFGVAILVVSPPLYWGDENTHFLHSYQLSELSFDLTPTPEGRMAALLPRGVGKLMLVLGLDRLAQQRGSGLVSRRRVLDKLQIAASPSDRSPLQLVNSNYSPLGYAPQALGIALTRACTSSVLLQLYGARLTNLVAWLLLVWVAIRIAPAFQLPLAVLALSPMSVFVATTCSADALTNALAFLWSAWVIRLAVGPMPYPRPVVLTVLAVALTLVKVAYGPLLALLLAVPAQRFGGPRQRRALLGALLAAAVAGTTLWSVIARWQIARGIPNQGIGAFRANLAMIVNDPLHVVRLVLDTVLLRSEAPWLYHVTGAMWGLVPPPALLWMWFAGVGAALLADDRSDQWPSLRARAVLLVVPLVTMFTIAVGAFLFWSPARPDTISGFQGRYAIPLLPALMIALCPTTSRSLARAVRKTLSAAALSVATSLLAYTVLSGLRLYG